ncbi:hypothetical protein V3C99_000140, partial [Haemonchus contortus]
RNLWTLVTVALSLLSTINCDGEEPDSEGGGGSGNTGAGTGVYRYKGTREEYCSKFAVNYEYYCTGDSDNPQITAQFCPSYKKSCRDTPQSPANPFTKNVAVGENPNSPSNVIDKNFPDFDNPKGSGGRRGRKRVQKKPKFKKACTADCDQRIHKHCTAECKCDYAYPYVQKFCNPPPLPLFLNTCRLWYSGCPKYERYHYASQFIYSKAEKGKKVELPASQKPFSVLSPNGERLPVNVRQPGTTTWTKDDPLPPDTVRWDLPTELDPENFEPILHEKLGSADASNDVEKFDLSRVKGTKSTPKQTKDKTLSQKDDPGEDKSAADERSKDTPIVPSDSVFSNALQQYGSFTDSGGVLHRPRSRSPFTKPGLWEPNPDNPHNRDHANKWYYHPRSVNVDWLSGQIAWGAHWAVPAAAVGGTDGFSTIHFPTIGTFAKIPDDYD